MRDKVEIALLHLRRLVELKGEKIGVMEMRNHASWYLRVSKVTVKQLKL